MLDFFQTIIPVYNRFRSQMNNQNSCQNISSLAKTGADLRLLLVVDSEGRVSQSTPITEEGIYVYRLSFKKILPRLRFDVSEIPNINDPASQLIKLIDEFIQVFEKTSERLPENHASRKLKANLQAAISNSTLSQDIQEAINKIQPEILLNSNKTVDIVFDIDSSINFQSSLPDIARRVNVLAESGEGKTGTDVFGNQGIISDESFGLVNNSFVLYQKDANVGAYASYGLNSVECCPLTKTTRQNIHDVASWVLSAENKSKMWNVRFNDDRMDLVVLVPEAQDKVSIEELSSLCYDILGNDFFEAAESLPAGSAKPEKEEESLEAFSSKAKSAIATLNGIIKEDHSVKFTGFVAYRKGSKGALSTNTRLDFSAESLQNAIQWWNDSCSNAVVRMFPRFKNRKFDGYHTSVPIHPFQLPRIMNICWTRGAGVSSSNKIIPNYAANNTFIRFTQADAINFFLRKDKKIADRIIKQFVEHHLNLMIDAARRSNRNDSPLLIKNRLDVLKLPAIVSIALSVKGITKMEQEENVGFILGQVLGIADWLHASRCYVKNTTLPSDLIGSRFISSFTCRHSPSESIVRFGREFNFLSNWANIVNNKGVIKNVDQEATDDIIKKYRWLRSLLGKLEGKIPDRLSNEDLAMLTIGYYGIRPFYPYKNKEGTKAEA